MGLGNHFQEGRIVTESQALEIMGIFVKVEACVMCPHFKIKTSDNLGPFIGWTSCGVTNGKAPYEECRGIKKEATE